MDFREQVKQFLLTHKKEFIAINIKIEISYKKTESISLFSDYLMELSDECTSFFFVFNYEVDINELSNKLSNNEIGILERQKEITELKKINRTDTTKKNMLIKK